MKNTSHFGLESFQDLARAGIVVLLANAAFFLMILIVDTAIDHNKLFERVAEAASTGSIDNQDYPAGLTTYADRFTDCVGISLNLGGRADRSPRELMRDMEVPRIEGVGACPALIQMLEEKRNVTTASYSRYWHGYQIFSKPFLYFGGIKGLRYVFASLMLMVLMLYSMSISTALAGTQGPFLGVWFAGSFILLTDGADLSNVFTHSISLFSIFLTATIAFWIVRAGYKQRLFGVVVAAGCLNSFFDLLFNPPLGLSALIVGAAAALCDEEMSVRETIKLSLIIAVGWAIGFFGTYVCRFAIAAGLSDDPIGTLKEIYTAGMFRIGGIEYKIRPIVGWATVQNFGYPMLRPSFAFFVAITAAVVAILWRGAHRINLRPALLAFLAPVLVSVPWFEIFRNHSQHHHWFTYRSASFALVCLGAFVVFSLTPPKSPIKLQ